MTNLTVKNTHSYFVADEDRPAGAIRSLQEIRDRNFGKDAFVWEVAQGGRITKYKLLERFHAARNDYTDYLSDHFLPAMRLSDVYEDRYAPFFLEQSGVWPHVNKPMPQQSNQFQTFFLLEDAIVYSDYLKSNQEYIESVERYHEGFRESSY